ncbi:TPA: malonate decarboxylase subunit alpha [Klebsiella pneumoniae]|nr:malonate decarboxylase subunit alpha [Klebsiella pneumoniae]
MLKEHNWHQLKDDTAQRLNQLAPYFRDGKIIDAKDTVAALEAVIRSFDRVNIEGNNQKQADFLSECLCQLDPQKISGLHMVQSSVPLSSHLDLFEKGIAEKLDFAYAGPQDGRLAKLIQDGKIKLGAIHTYLELFSRYFVDLTPRVDIPGDWVNAVIEAPRPFYVEPLFTRDPGLITDTHVLMAMMALKGIYAEYGVERINHGIGFFTAAIELLLPTYGDELGLKGKVCTHMVLNPHPTLIPAIESGWIQSVHCFGGELGMEKYVAERPDIFYIGQDGTLRSNRAFAQAAGHYALDMFIGGTLQIDKYGNSSTATASRVSGFGGAPNMGCDAKGRRHATQSWLKCGEEFNATQKQLIGDMPRGKRLVVQMQETFREKRQPAFVDKLDAWELAEKANLALPPVMVYADDVTHVLTEEGIAYLHRCEGLEQRMAAIRAVAGYTGIGLAADPEQTAQLREAGIVKTPEDLGIDRRRANRQMLAAKSIRDLVDWSGGLYNPPTRFRNW